MKQHLQRLGKFFFLSTLMLLISCQNDEPASPVHQHDASTSRITLKQFKEETKISDFSSVFRTASIESTQGKGAESIGDFVIDTLAVEKYNSNHSTVSYSFFVYPINREEVGLNEIFNLVYYKDGNSWEASIFSLEKVSTSGNPDSYDNIEMLYGKLQNNAGICWSTTFKFHCTRTGPCESGTCDMCSRCVSTNSTSNVCASGGGAELPTDSVSPDFGVNNGGGGGAVSYAQFMSALELDPSQIGWLDRDENSFFKARLTEDYISLPSIAAVAEIRDEFKNKVNFLRTHYEMCQDITAYVIANHYFETAQRYAWEAVNIFIDGGEVDLPFRIIKDASFNNNPCLNSVYTKLGGASTFQNYLKNFDGNFSVANLKLSASNLANDTNAETSSPENYLITITFNQNKLNRPSLDIARTFIHELIHAEMYRKLMSLAGQPNIAFTPSLIQSMRNNYPGLYDYYIRYQSNISSGQIISSAQHEAMAQHYRNIIVQALKQFDSSQQDNIYQALAWIGLMGSGALNPSTGLPSNPTVAWQNLPQSQRLQIITTYTNFYNSNTPCQQ